MLVLQIDSRGFSYDSWSDHSTLSIESGRLHMICCFTELEKEMETKKGTSLSLAHCLLSLMYTHSTGALPLPSWGSSRKELIYPLRRFNVFITKITF